MNISEVVCEGVNCTELTQRSTKKEACFWRGLRNFGFQKSREFLPAE